MSEHNNLCGVYGFGSFFRNTNFNDIDLLLMSGKMSPSPLEDYYAAKRKLDLLSQRLGIEFDITFLTYSEFLKKPLLEMDNLVSIIINKT